MTKAPITLFPELTLVVFPEKILSERVRCMKSRENFIQFTLFVSLASLPSSPSSLVWRE